MEGSVLGDYSTYASTTSKQPSDPDQPQFGNYCTKQRRIYQRGSYQA